MTERNALLIAALTSFTWGFTGIFVRLLPSVSPLALTAARLAVALAVSLPVIFILRSTRREMASTASNPVAYFLAGLLIGYYLLAVSAFQMAPVAEVALLLSTPPLFILAFRVMREAMPVLAEFLGALIALAGLAMILVPKIAETKTLSSRHLQGDGIAIGAAILIAIYAYSYRLLSARGRAPSTGGVSLLTFVLGSLILFAAFAVWPTGGEIEQLREGRSVALLLGLGIISTAIPSFGFAIASTRLPPMVSSTISLFIPIFAAVFAFLILDEKLTMTFLLGCCLVLGGVALIIQRPGAKAAVTPRG